LLSFAHANRRNEISPDKNTPQHQRSKPTIMITSIKEYNNQAGKINSQIAQENIFDVTNTYHKDYLFTAANWRHFFGERSSDKVDDFFREYVFQKKLMELDFQTNLDWLLGNFELKGDLDFIKHKQTQPYIFASFHFGPYQMQGLVLSEILKIKYAVLANSALYLDQFTQFLTTKYNDPKAKGKEIILSKEDVVNPESLDALIQMRSKIKDGKSLLVYLDGMEGLTGYLDRSKMLNIEFCGKKFFARKGIARIAHFLKTPVIPLITRRTSLGTSEVIFAPPVDPRSTRKWQDFVQDFMQDSYSFFEPYFLETPEQWEVFDHLHMYFYENAPEYKTDTVLETPQTDFIIFNEEKFGVFKEIDTFYLFDKTTFGLFKISEPMAKFLSGFGKQPAREIIQAMKPELFNDLFKKEILIGSAS
jgi:lauroyl/myristoyl acyltransferase